MLTPALLQGAKAHINYYALSLPLSLLISQNACETWVQQPAAEQRGLVMVATASWRGQLCGQFVAKRRHARSSDAKSRMRRHVMSKAAPLARFTSRSPPALARSRSLGSGGTPLQRRPAVTSKPRVTSSIERAQIMSLYSPRAAHKAKSTIRARNAALSRFRGSTNPPRLPPSPCQPFRQTNRSIRCRTARVDHRKV